MSTTVNSDIMNLEEAMQLVEAADVIRRSVEILEKKNI